MRHDGEVQLLQVDTLGLPLVPEDVGVVSGIKQDALAGILDERGEPPILPHRRSFAEGIVKDGDLGRARLSIGRRGANGCHGYRHCSHGEEEMPRHVTPSTARGWRECGCGVKPPAHGPKTGSVRANDGGPFEMAKDRMAASA